MALARLDHPAGPAPAGGPARERQGRGRRCGPGRQARRMRLPGASTALFRYHAEPEGRSRRTQAYPPIGATADLRLTRPGPSAGWPVRTAVRARRFTRADVEQVARTPADYSPKPRNTPSSPAAPANSSQSIFEMFRLLSTPRNSDGMHRKGVRPVISG